MRVTKENQKKIKEHEAPIKERALQMYMDGTKNRSKITRKLIDEGFKVWGSNGFFNFRSKVNRWLKEFEIQGINPALAEECEAVGIDISRVNHAWYKGKYWSINFKPDNNGPSFEQMYQDHIDAIEQHTFKYEKIKREKQDDPHLLVVDPADVHIGKLSTSFATGTDYSGDEAVRRVKEGVQKIIDYSSSFEIDQILFVAGNDILHTDNTKRSTTKGTPQDTDGMWYDNYRTAKELYIDCLENLVQIADVHYMFNPSNHDYMAGFYLSDMIKAWFKDCKNISFETDLMYRKYFKYHKNLIGTTHGDGAKHQDLGSLMSVEAKKYWADTNHKYFYVHHVHHKTSKDYINVTVESLRSPTTTDVWHSMKGYVSPQAIEGFLHHPTKGQVARYTYTF
ncbi:MAG: hypothetical protein Unbinned6046contig1000_16 [Prokaryotic dsDNA virus sp.]|nr:MAG: hypothetical protein Unbinned6046contig1000_16 [Prokaryotic dsDNA virus sp.]|tara:strand:+ start:2080 stop:3261 length:1182 start_codon:yes stop_codon:yes gene_type:complete